MLPVPFARRCRLTSAVGPDASGSKPGIEWFHTPDKSGIDTAPCLPPWDGPAVGATVCAEASVAVAAASVTTKRTSRRSTLMISSSSLGPAYPVKAYVALVTPVKRLTDAIWRSCGHEQASFATLPVMHSGHEVIGIRPKGTITRA